MSLHNSLHHSAAREWSEPHIHPSNLIYPIFVTDKVEDKQIPGFEPNVQWGMGADKSYSGLIEYLKGLQAIGLRSVMLFGVVAAKDAKATPASTDDTPVIVVTKLLRKSLPELQILLDVCMCEYTDHGHCGWLRQVDGEEVIDNTSSIEHLAEIALSYAKAGAHWVCPSDMMDGRVGKIREKLDSNGFTHVGIMAYTSKKASTMYAPFRAAVDSTFTGDRKRYQQPWGSTFHSMQALSRDVNEGAAVVLVKPSLFYGDIISKFSQRCDLPVAVYVVSGEYVMLRDYAMNRSGDLETVLKESHISLLRAGASILITYFTPELLKMHHERKL